MSKVNLLAKARLSQLSLWCHIVPPLKIIKREGTDVEVVANKTHILS